jgi:hypothetical protein
MSKGVAAADRERVKQLEEWASSLKIVTKNEKASKNWVGNNVLIGWLAPGERVYIGKEVPRRES